MTEQEQIEEMAKLIDGSECPSEKCPKMDKEQVKAFGACNIHRAQILYNAGYRKVPEYAVTMTAEERDEEMRLMNEERADYETQIEILSKELRNECEKYEKFVFKVDERFEELKKKTARECLKILHSIGGCGATEEWSKALTRQ